MYQRALEGYEKALGPEAVKTYIPALNTIENLGDLFKEIDRIKKAKELYLRAIFGVEAVFGHSNKRFRNIQTSLSTLYD